MQAISLLQHAFVFTRGRCLHTKILSKGNALENVDSFKKNYVVSMFLHTSSSDISLAIYMVEHTQKVTQTMACVRCVEVDERGLGKLMHSPGC